jgi:hypothetical protein
MNAEIFLLRYETVLETVESGISTIDDVLMDLKEDNYTEEQIYSTLTKMEEKKYISISDEGTIVKLKGLSTFSD